MSKISKIRNVEGVPYYRFHVAFRTKDGKRHRMVYWSPGFPWVRGEVARSLDAYFGIENVRPGSCTIVQEDP